MPPDGKQIVACTDVFFIQTHMEELLIGLQNITDIDKLMIMFRAVALLFNYLVH